MNLVRCHGHLESLEPGSPTDDPLVARETSSLTHFSRLPGDELTPLLAGIAVYVSMQLILGVIASRRVSTEDDYLIAGRTLGPVLTTFTVFATWFGAETCIGAAGAVYTDGLIGGTADPFGYGICILLAGALLAGPLWRMKLTTLGDLFQRRFDVTVERVAVFLMVPTSLFWAAAQIKAFGQVLSSAGGFDLDIAITIAALIVITYTMFGGLLADAWTDLVQGVVLLIGLIALFSAVIQAEGWSIFQGIAPDRLTISDGGSRSILAVIEDWAIPVVGSLMAAEVVARMIAARSPEIARRATITAGGLYLLVGLIPVSLGLLGAGLVPGLVEGEQILPELASRYLPTFLAMIFTGALVSAILSTVDSALLVSAGLLSHNIVGRFRPDMTERGRVRLARGFVAGFGLLAYVMAFHAERVYDLVEQASAFGSSGIVVVVLFGLFSSMGGPLCALCSLVAGVSVWIASEYVLGLSYPYLTSLGSALVGYLTPLLMGLDRHGRST